MNLIEISFPLARNQEDFLNVLRDSGYVITVNSDTWIYTATPANGQELKLKFNDAN